MNIPILKLFHNLSIFTSFQISDLIGLGHVTMMKRLLLVENALVLQPLKVLPRLAISVSRRVLTHFPSSYPFSCCVNFQAQLQDKINNFKMSSPGHRRQRSSQSATPRRSSQRNAIPSSPPDPAASQLQNEAASSQANGTPRRVAPSSSPMNYRSSPAELARANRDVSSPLRQMTNTQTTQDGDRTPRASGLLGGKQSQSVVNRKY
jgi:hypothetical protein